MKEKLAKAVYTGTFVQFREDLKGPLLLVLIKNICDASGREVTDKLWFHLPKGFASWNLKDGERIEFRARVKENQKGYSKGYISKVRVLKAAVEPQGQPPQATASKPMLREVDEEQIDLLYDKGFSSADIARILGCEVALVDKYCTDHVHLQEQRSVAPAAKPKGKRSKTSGKPRLANNPDALAKIEKWVKDGSENLASFSKELGYNRQTIEKQIDKMRKDGKL